MVSHLSLSMLPGSVDEVHGEDFHTQASLDAVHHHLEALTVPDHEAWMVQLIRHLLEVQIGVL